MNVVEDKKAENIVLLNLPPDAVIADYFIICNGTSDRQLRALTDYVREAVKEQYNTLPFATEGDPDSGWVLMDFGDVIVHLFTSDQRAYYDLESFWRRAAVLVSIQ